MQDLRALRCDRVGFSASDSGAGWFALTDELAAFDYPFPEELIARHPAQDGGPRRGHDLVPELLRRWRLPLGHVRQTFSG